jgi:alpha-glucosidase
VTQVQPWWADSVGYQVYISSFADSDGDGLGDLGGVLHRLEHLERLGIDIVWITPFFPSPQLDNGYDVSDYLDVDARFGDVTTLTAVIDDAHRRGMRVVLDLVCNHTSSAHPWFVESRSNRESEKRDYYIWRDPGAEGGPPNNWLSHFGGPAWTLDEATGQYYLHLFLAEQPDLNWEDARVAAEIDAVVARWMEWGVDGLRIDTAQLFAKAPGLPDNPPARRTGMEDPTGVTTEWEGQEHLHEVDQPRNTEVFRRWKRITREHDALLVGEVYLPEVTRLLRYVEGDGLDSTFYFPPVSRQWHPEEILAGVREAALAAAGGPVFSWVLSSHDSRRAVSRFGGGESGRRRALTLHTLLFFLPGTPFLYQGEELGLEDGAVPVEAMQDPVVRRGGAPERSRDVSRTPMPWAPEPGFGFTTASEPWLPYGGRTAGDTVEVQAGDPDSWLSRYRRLIEARRSVGGLSAAPLDWPSIDGPLVRYRRGDLVDVVANVGDAPLPWEGHGRILFSTEMGDADLMPPGSAVVLAL